MNNIPQKVKAYANNICGGFPLKHIGTYKGEEAYITVFPDNYVGGFGVPFVYLYNKTSVRTLSIAEDRNLETFINKHF